MAEKQDFDKDIHLSSFDDLFQTDESREDMKREKLMDIPISMIQDFPDHPYKVKDDENMAELVESVKTRGLVWIRGRLFTVRRSFLIKLRLF